MKKYEDIIIKPYITEKTNNEISNGVYTFVVDVNATKTEIRKAVEALFQVKVLKVNTINCKPKFKRLGVHQGYTSKWKKAYIKIDTNPEAEEYLVKDGKRVSTGKKYKTSIEEFGFAQ